MKKNLRYRW